MAALPPVARLAADPALLAPALATLFEPSPLLHTALAPPLAASLATDPPASYAALVDRATATIRTWPPAAQAAFVAAHPRIGQVTGLSQLSAQEQAARAAPPEVLAALAALNARYEARFPGLRYVTFVAGRSRAEVRDEMARLLGEGEADGAEGLVYAMDSPQWRAELQRAVVDVGRIAKSRARALGEA